jgi:CheY-like chemotaxis protein
MQAAKVLVVDDSTSVRKVLERLLSTRGLVVTTSETAEQGLEALRHSTPDLVIADVVMPGMSGFELCQMLKLSKTTQAVPVILISGIINEGVVAQAQQAGAFDVVSKPFTPEDLFPKIERALSATRQAAPPVGKPAVKPAPVTSPAPVPAAPVFTGTSATPPLAASAVSSPVVVVPTHTEPLPPPQPAAPAQGYNQALMDNLRPLLDKPEIESVLVISRMGKLLAWVGQTVEEPDLLATYLHTLLSISSVMGDRYHLSSVQSLSLEYLGKTVMVNRINNNSSLALVLRGTGGTGVTRYLVLKHLPQLKAVLDE